MGKLAYWSFEVFAVVAPVVFGAMFTWVWWLLFTYGSDHTLGVKLGTLFGMSVTAWVLYLMWTATRS